MATTTLTSALSAEYLQALKEAQEKEKALKEKEQKEKEKERPETEVIPSTETPKRTTTTTKAPTTRRTTTSTMEFESPTAEYENEGDDYSGDDHSGDDYSGDDYSGDDESGDDDGETEGDHDKSKTSPTNRPNPPTTQEPIMTMPTVDPAKEMMAKLADQARKIETDMMLDMYDLATSAVINNLGTMIELVEPVLVTVHETMSRWLRWSNQALNNVMLMFNWTWWPLFSMIFK